MKSTRASLVKDISDKLNMPLSKCNIIINTFIDQMIIDLKEGKDIEIRGLGTFKITETKERLRMNPRTRELITTKNKRVIKFRQSSTLEVVNE